MLGFTDKEGPVVVWELPGAKGAEWSPNGSLLVAWTEREVRVLSVSESHRPDQALRLDPGPALKRNVVAAMFSPRGTFLALLVRMPSTPPPSQQQPATADCGSPTVPVPTAADRGVGQLVMQVFRSECARQEHWGTQEHQQAEGPSSLVVEAALRREQFPGVQWSADEAWAARLENGRWVVQRGDLTGPRTPLALEGITRVSWAPASGVPLLALLVPERRGQPAQVQIALVGAAEGDGAGGPKVTLLGGKSFFRADSVQLLWGWGGRGLVVLSHSETDTSGRSYYGEDHAYLLRMPELRRGSARPQVQAEDLPVGKEGPLHELQWAPEGPHLACLAGFVPPRAQILHARQARPVQDLGKMPRNTLRWAPPRGRLLLLAGLGSLQADPELWDWQAPGGPRVVARLPRGYTTHLSWAPNGRLLAAYTLAQKLKVENGFRLHRTDGRLVYQETMRELLQLDWRPAVPPFPESTTDPTWCIAPAVPNSASASSSAASPGSANPAADSKGSGTGRAAGGVYRHPHFSGERRVPGAEEVPQRRFERLHPPAQPPASTSTAPAPAAPQPQQANQPRLPPGAELSEPHAGGTKKKKKKRAGAGASQEAPPATAVAASEAPASAAVAPAPQTQAKPAASAGAAAAGGTETEKRVRVLQKKIRQIEALREQARSRPLNPAELEKVAQEDDLRRQLRELTASSS